MKKLVLGLGLLGLVAACKSQDTAQISDASSANVPTAECCTAGDDCDGSGCEAKTECTEKAGATCPYSGKTIEN